MATYYEVLALPPSASEPEIEAALDGLYTQWRRLVTHHDASVADQANQALRQLEAIRVTLLDTAKRAGYDAGIGVSGTVGGLADPEALLQSAAVAAPAPPRPAARRPLRAAAPAPDQASLWMCPKQGCGAENPPNTKHCFKCGLPLVRECPQCGKMKSLIATGYCGECGANYDTTTERNELEAALDERQGELDDLQSKMNEVVVQAEITTHQVRSDRIISVLVGLGCLICIGVAIAIIPTSTQAFGGLLIVALVLGSLAVMGWLTSTSLKSRLTIGDTVLESLQDQYDETEALIGSLQQRYESLSKPERRIRRR